MQQVIRNFALLTEDCLHCTYRNWDNMIWGADMLLLGMPNVVSEVKLDLERFLQSWMYGLNGIQYTPEGLAWTPGGSALRNVANAGGDSRNTSMESCCLFLMILSC